MILELQKESFWQCKKKHKIGKGAIKTSLRPGRGKNVSALTRRKYPVFQKTACSKFEPEFHDP